MKDILKRAIVKNEFHKIKALNQIYLICSGPQILVIQINQTKLNYLICLVYEGKINKILTFLL